MEPSVAIIPMLHYFRCVSAWYQLELQTLAKRLGVVVIQGFQELLMSQHGFSSMLMRGMKMDPTHTVFK